MNILEVFTYNQYFVAMMNIINAARLNPPISGHKHHIIPKCWFKLMKLPVDNSKTNLILLSYEDHIKVHKLALLCVSLPIMKSKMALAVHRLTNGEYSEPKYWSKELNSNYRKPRSIEIRNKISTTKKERMNNETRSRISNAMKGNKHGLGGKASKGQHWHVVNGRREYYV